MPCCQCCCGGVTCVEGQQGKCCCGGPGGVCCGSGQYCCNGVCQPTPCCVNAEYALFISVDRGSEDGAVCIYADAVGHRVGSYFSCPCPLPERYWLNLNGGAFGYEAGDGQTLRFLAGDRNCAGSVPYPMTVRFSVQWVSTSDSGKPLTVTASWVDSTSSTVLTPGGGFGCPEFNPMLYAHVYADGSLYFGTNPLP